jgi:hypothetical protein
MSKKLNFALPSIHDGLRMNPLMKTSTYTFPQFDHIENIYNDIETYPQPGYIRNGDRFIRHKKDPRAIGNPHTVQEACLEMDFIESPLCMIQNDPIPDNKIVNIWNCQKEVQSMREKSQQMQQQQQQQQQKQQQLKNVKPKKTRK